MFLGDGKFLEQADIPHFRTGLPQRVAPDFTVFQFHKAKSVCVEPARRIGIAELRILTRHVVGPLCRGSRALPVALLRDREGETSLISKDPTYRPDLSSDSSRVAPIPGRRNAPHEAGGVAMAVVIFAVCALVGKPVLVLHPLYCARQTLVSSIRL